jgi:hypothetical protein
MYLQIGYSNAPSASGLLARQGAKPQALVAVPRSGYVDAEFVEVAAAHPSVPSQPQYFGLTRAQAAIRLYVSIFNYREHPAATLSVSV